MLFPFLPPPPPPPLPPPFPPLLSSLLPWDLSPPQGTAPSAPHIPLSGIISSLKQGGSAFRPRLHVGRVGVNPAQLGGGGSIPDPRPRDTGWSGGTVAHRRWPEAGLRNHEGLTESQKELSGMAGLPTAPCPPSPVTPPMLTGWHLGGPRHRPITWGCCLPEGPNLFPSSLGIRPPAKEGQRGTREAGGGWLSRARVPG